MSNLTSNDSRKYIGNVRIRAENQYVNITTATNTNAIKTGNGVLRKIIINKAVASGVITIYDDLIATGSSIIGTITFPATLLENQKVLDYDCNFNTGLSIKTVQANDLTVVYD